MAGYSGYSKSNNAIAAEADNRYPASVLAKVLKVPTQAIKDLLAPCEYHHSSSWYNEVDYYDGSLLIPLAANELPDDDLDDEVYEAAGLLVALRTFKVDKKPGWVCDDCAVEWIEWSGTRRRPRADERRQEHCRVAFNGKSTYTITTPRGVVFRKREGTNGFSVKLNAAEMVA